LVGAGSAGSTTGPDTSSARTGTERFEQINISTSRYDRNFLKFVFMVLSLSKIVFTPSRYRFMSRPKRAYEVSGARFTSADRAAIYLKMCID
jgi:hypothetical protein